MEISEASVLKNLFISWLNVLYSINSLHVPSGSVLTIPKGKLVITAYNHLYMEALYYKRMQYKPKLPGFAAELSLRVTGSPYYVSKEHTFSDQVIPLQVPPNMPPSPEPDIHGSTFTRNPRVCVPRISFRIWWEKFCCDDKGRLVELPRWGLFYEGMECG